MACMTEETMRKPRSSVVKLQPWRIAIFNYLKEKGKSTKEIAKERPQSGKKAGESGTWKPRKEQILRKKTG